MEKLDNNNSISKFELELENKNRADEIIELNKELIKYKIEFTSLVNNSPKHKGTRNNVLKLVFKICNNSEISNFISLSIFIQSCILFFQTHVKIDIEKYQSPSLKKLGDLVIWCILGTLSSIPHIQFTYNI